LKPWLLNILACPIDKYHPLEAYFFRWETPEAEIAKVVTEAGKPSAELEEKYRVLRKQLGDGTISPPSISAIADKTGSKVTEELLGKTVKLLAGKPGRKEELDTIYRYLNMLELSEGLLFCPECRRWYPIGSAVESIPELMPDELREKEKDTEWLGKWRNLAPEKAVKRGQPFSLE
jgi:uncharacterized protein YbaR (Trm112 family)